MKVSSLNLEWVTNKDKGKDMNKIFEDYYATSTGQIYSNKTHTYLKQRISRRGYYIVNLSVKGKCKTYSVHRLIAKAFIPNPNNYPIINHIDGNKLNNNISNLEWCSYKYNSIHAVTHNLRNTARGIDTKHGQFTEDDIIRIRKLKELGLSQYKIATKYGVTRSTIQQILNGTTYKWLK